MTVPFRVPKPKTTTFQKRCPPGTVGPMTLHAVRRVRPVRVVAGTVDGTGGVYRGPYWDRDEAAGVRAADYYAYGHAVAPAR
jgi:hypothetical protein